MTDKPNEKTATTPAAKPAEATAKPPAAKPAEATAKPPAAKPPATPTEIKKTLKGLNIDSKLPDEATVLVCAKHLRMMKIEVEGLDKETPNHRAVRAPVGKVRKALAAANK